LAVPAVIALAIGCGGNSTPTSPASSAPSSPRVSPAVASAPTSSGAPVPTTGAGSAVPSVATTVPPPASQPAPRSLDPFFSSHGDPALEALLPTAINGKLLTIYSLTLTQLLDQGGDRPAIDAFLLGIGKSEADGSWAAAFDATNPAGGGVNAFKVAGADPAPLLAGITAWENADLGTNATLESATVSGKTVTVLSIGNGVNDTEWIYGHGDVVFVVHAANESDAGAFLEALP
jgi:hypothetical protein